MGCITSFGKIILIILNLVLLLVSLALIAVGVILKFFSKDILKWISDVSKLEEATLQSHITDLNIPAIGSIENLPFLDQIGVALIVFGCVLFVISFCACCGACYKIKWMLIVFIILMAILVAVQATIGGLFLAKKSPLHQKIKSELNKQMLSQYDEKNKDDVFSFSINLLNYLLDCCGITGTDDFPPAEQLPKSCCRKQLIDGGDLKCNSPPVVSTAASSADFNTQGCYDTLQDTVLKNTLLAGVILALLLLFQLILILFAYLIMKDENSVSPI